MFLLTLVAPLLFLSPAFLSPAFLSPAFAQAPVSSAVDEGILRDWQTREHLDENALQQLPSACCGMFVEPPRVGEFSDQNPDISPTEIQTPDNVRQPRPGQLYVDGEVTVRQGHRELRADEGLHLDEETNILTLLGDVVFREPGFLVTGQGARIDQSSGRQSNRPGFLRHAYHPVARLCLAAGL
jgi:LPS-assembly protein